MVATGTETAAGAERVARARGVRLRRGTVALVLGASVAVLAVNGLGCKKPDPGPVTPASASAGSSAGPVQPLASSPPGGSASASASSSADGAPPPPPGTGADDDRPPGFHAPVKLWLRAAGDPSNVSLHLEVEVLTASDFPGTLVVSLPPGATLAKGAASQSVSLTQTGKQGFEVQITSPTPLTDAAPIRVTLDGRDPSGASGFHAERRWPEKVAAPPPPRSGPTPPGGRPPLPPRKTKE
jgi:hypothetical protein